MAMCTQGTQDKGHFPSRAGQRRLRTKAGLRMGAGLNRGQGGKCPTVSELRREPSPSDWAPEGPWGVSPAPGAAGRWLWRGHWEDRQPAAQHLCSCSQEARSSGTVPPPREGQETSKGPEHHWSERAGAGGLDLRKDGTQPPLRMQGLLEASGSLCPTVQLQTEAQGLLQVDSRIIKQS